LSANRLAPEGGRRRGPASGERSGRASANRTERLHRSAFGCRTAPGGAAWWWRELEGSGRASGRVACNDPCVVPGRQAARPTGHQRGLPHGHGQTVWS